MSADINAIVDKIIADAEKKVRTDLEYISSKAKNDFITKAKEVVMLYYSHYPKPPRIYERTNNLRDNVVDSDLSFVALNKTFNVVSKGSVNYFSDNSVLIIENNKKFIADGFCHRLYFFVSLS